MMNLLIFNKIPFLSILLISSLFINCSNDDTTLYEKSDTDTSSTINNDNIISEIGDNHEADEDYIWDTTSVVGIVLNGTSITVNGVGATVNGTTVTITAAGNYEITGTLNNGQIVVDTQDEENVRLIFNGINVTNTTNAPINIANSEKTIIVLTKNTTNYLTDSSTYLFNADEDEPNATLYSADNLTIYGEGTLFVNANYNDGITSKDGLIIKSGTINITAKDEGIRGKDYVIVKGGVITINAEGDGLKSDNEDDTSKGFVIIESGKINITAKGDAISAASNIEILDGDLTLKSGGGYSSYLSSNDSAKGIKAGYNVLIEDGIFNINSADDNIHCATDITINSGTFELASGDDAIHSDDTIEINGGTIKITTTVEGIESPNITINDGDIYITSSDDAINAAGNTSNNLIINGGYLVLNSAGDGLDSNGNIEMNGGTVIVNGPTASNNSPIDYDGNFKLNSGLLVATGYASNMDAAGSNTSTQYSVLIKLTSTQNAENLVHIKNSDDENIITFKPSKKYKSIVFSSSELTLGKTYSIYLGGSSTGTATDGVYKTGTYSAGTLYKSFTISNKVTTVN